MHRSRRLVAAVKRVGRMTRPKSIGSSTGNNTRNYRSIKQSARWTVYTNEQETQRLEIEDRRLLNEKAIDMLRST